MGGGAGPCDHGPQGAGGMNQPGDSYEYDNGAAPTCAVEGGVSSPVSLEAIRGKLT